MSDFKREALEYDENKCRLTCHVCGVSLRGKDKFCKPMRRIPPVGTLVPVYCKGCFDALNEEPLACTCTQTCRNPCKGECGCRACHQDYMDFLSAE